MKFFAVNGERPTRLSEATRQFAYESLNHKYGKKTVDVQNVSLDDLPDYESMTPLQQYDAAIERIATQAPIRICENEKISGAATLGAALRHMVPAAYNGKDICRSFSHLTIDFETVLKKS